MKRLLILLSLIVCALGLWAQRVTYSVSSRNTDTNAFQDGERGVCCVTDFAVHNFSGGARMCAELQYKTAKGTWAAVRLAHSSNLNYAVYSAGNGTVWAQGRLLNITRGRNSFSGYKMFLPNNAITHPAGRVDYRWRIFVFEDGDDILEGDYIYNSKGGYYEYCYFSMNWSNTNR
jgi:hypothetical protein